MGTVDADVLEVDEFLGCIKTLDGGYPIWKKSARSDELTAIWNINDELGINRADLRFRLSLNNLNSQSALIVFRNEPVWRVDLVAPSVCEQNPVWAQDLGVPPEVCGSHYHNWADNREYVLRTQKWELPVRRPLQKQIRRFSQIVPWLADQINIGLRPGQRGFDIPPRSDLFGNIS